MVMSDEYIEDEQLKAGTGNIKGEVHKKIKKIN